MACIVEEIEQLATGDGLNDQFFVERRVRTGVNLQQPPEDIQVSSHLHHSLLDLLPCLCLRHSSSMAPNSLEENRLLASVWCLAERNAFEMSAGEDFILANIQCSGLVDFLQEASKCRIYENLVSREKLLGHGDLMIDFNPTEVTFDFGDLQ